MVRVQDVAIERAPSDDPVPDELAVEMRLARLADQERLHELRNALTAAFGHIAWLRARSAQWTDRRDRRAVEAVHVSLRLASRLVQDEDGDEARKHCSLRQLTAIAASQVTPLRAEDIVFSIRTEDALVGRWNADRIVQVLLNLLGNAVKYSPAGTPIVVELARRGDWARIAIKDQGIGIEAADLEAIFDGYRTELAQLVSDGSGIGLGLSRRLVEAEGGRLGVSSTAGIESEFWVELPLTVSAESAAQVQPMAHRQACGGAPDIDALRQEVTAVLDRGVHEPV